MTDRKKDHIDLAFQSQTLVSEADRRFYYEPLLQPHPGKKPESLAFLGKTLQAPVWISSMTGGTEKAFEINSRLAKVCREFGLGMGLGSCRKILTDNTHFADFDLRDIIGEDLPFFANLGICQIEEIVENNKFDQVTNLINRLRADGLIIHVNPMQEWFQPEGDTLLKPPIETITRFLDKVEMKVIVKEVGQGMGPSSLSKLLKLPLAAVEFGAFGGTNFAKMELLRSKEASESIFEPLAYIGENAENMVTYINRIVADEKEINCKEVIVSGGVKSFLDGYYYINKLQIPAIYGQASAFLKHAAISYEELYRYAENQVMGLALAYSYLRIRE
ncbi:MAG: type 2 isopentenyl-diphosphate Delta-isomerase [Bacteroidales bacterium]|nr:type 2 isopentenyl-diphosphate Delta-isomerase [Bacteroidales bacterium]